MTTPQDADRVRADDTLVEIRWALNAYSEAVVKQERAIAELREAEAKLWKELDRVIEAIAASEKETP